jgi:ribosome-binding protein aMBF1 (putative translation factor)
VLAQGTNTLPTWRELHDIFRALQPSDKDGLYARWTGARERWDLLSEPSATTLRRFKNAAGWAAQKSANGSTWEAFMNVLKQDPEMFEWTTTSVSKQFSLRHQREIEVSVMNGEIKRVCEAAADYCEKLLPHDEKDARVRAAMERIEQRSYESFRMSSDYQPTKSPNLPVADNQAEVDTTGSQIERLRQECRWSEEDLADAVGLDLTTVSRHIRGVMEPTTRNCGKYDRAFSKHLKRKVLIEKTPRKRPGNA